MYRFPGDPDENVYIVQSGRLNVFITTKDGTSLSLKIVKPGESVTSLLSFTDVLTVSHLSLSFDIVLLYQKYIKLSNIQRLPVLIKMFAKWVNDLNHVLLYH